MSGKRKLLAVTAALTVAAIVAGGAAVTSAHSAPAAYAVSAATGCTSSKGTMKYGIAGAGISQLDPNTINFAGQVPLQTLLYNGLAKYDRNMDVIPDLASKWRASKDLKTWWFTLRKGVKYSTGRAFTAEDARANILRVLDPKVPSQQRANAKDIRSVRVLNPYLLRIKLGSPSAILPNALVDIKMSDTNNVADLARSGTGTGPYKVGSFTPNLSLTLVPNPNHFGGRACISRIEFVRSPDPTAMVTDFRARNLDMIWQVRPTDVPALKSAGTSFLAPKGVSGAHVWELDVTSEPFNDVRARQALSYAINRRAMNQAAFSGIAAPSFGNSLISAGSSAYNKKLKGYPFNLQKAKQLFDAAGVKPGTTFTFWALAGRRDEWITMAQILQQDLQKIGLNLSIQRSDVSTWLSKFFPAGKRYPNTIIANYFSMPPNPTYALKQGQFGSCECNWKNTTFEALALKAPGIIDLKARQKVYDTMQQIFSSYAPVMVIAHQTNIVAFQKRVQNAWEDAQGNVHLEEARVSG
ncbi:MAG: ABC transporter substrate-binding protein [Thermoleophilia bacterium]|nr:ABC transporter substrate-binding protein [Thermoleophilia bacterium]